MSLQDLKNVIDSLPQHERDEIRQYLEQTPTTIDDREVIEQVRQIYADAPPPQIRLGQLDIEKLLAALETFRSSFTESELDALLQDINSRPRHS